MINYSRFLHKKIAFMVFLGYLTFIFSFSGVEAAYQDPLEVTISPSNAVVSLGETQQFKATRIYWSPDQMHIDKDVSDTADWSIQGNIGSISPEGVFTAHNIGQGSVTVNYFDPKYNKWKTVSTNIIVQDNSAPPSVQTTSEYNSQPTTNGQSNPGVLVNGQAITFTDISPFFDDNGRTLLPIRAPMEALGVKVLWDEVTRSVTLIKGQKTVIFTIDSPYYSVNGTQAATMDTTPQQINGRVVLPIRYAAQEFGANVQWNEQSFQVEISTISDSNPSTNPIEAIILSPDYLIPEDLNKTYVFWAGNPNGHCSYRLEGWSQESDEFYRTDVALDNEKPFSIFYYLQDGSVLFQKTISNPETSGSRYVISGQAIDLAPVSPGQSWDGSRLEKEYSMGTAIEHSLYVKHTFVGMEDINIMNSTYSAAHIHTTTTYSDTPVVRDGNSWLVKGLGVVKYEATTSGASVIPTYFTMKLIEIR